MLALVADVWLALFGTAPPCDAVVEQVPYVIAGRPKEAADATYAAVAKLSSLRCAGIALQLKAGDKSALQVAAVGE